MSTPRSVIVVGNPKPRSRTYQAAERVIAELTGSGPDAAYDLIDFGPALLDFEDAAVAGAISALAAADLAVFASPTYKGSYTGLLKLFLDRIGGGALAGLTAVPLMLGGDRRHSLASDGLLKPVLVELGATCPTQGLFLVDREWDDPAALAGWLELGRRQIAATLGHLR
jgi:FMN reductase